MLQPAMASVRQSTVMTVGPSPSHGMTSPPVGGQPAFQGTLAPGTRVMIGPIIVTVQKYLSQGGFAHVYLVTTDKPIAMPVSDTSVPGATSTKTRGETLHVLKRMAVPDKEALASVRSEVEVHKSLRSHPNIVHFIEASATALQGGGYEIFILMEYCSGGGIIDLMNARMQNRLTEAEVLKIFGDVAAGLAVMHHMDPPLLHRDLKVENILLAPPPRSNPSAGPTYKLCDFGSSITILSRRAPKSLEEVKRLEADLNMHTTLQYRAPEMVDVYQRRIIDEKADVWAMGVLLYKLCYYTTPFEENGGGPLAILNCRYRFPPSPNYSQRLKDLIASMLQEQSTSRPTIDQVIIAVHNILGTKASASAIHYANLVATGKQVQSLPSIVSSSSSSSKSYSGSAADVAAKAMANRSTTSDNEPAAGVSKDLIETAPSENEQRSVEQEELKRRSEGITPMRRGRPNRASIQPSSSSSSAAAAVAVATTNLILSDPSQSKSPSKGSIPAQPSGHQYGFTDSFSPPSLSATQHLAPSRPDSGMHYSPSMPGMVPSNRASPLPPLSLSPAPPAAATTTNQSQHEEATTRFPSVEQLDLQYGTSQRPKPASNIPRSRTITIPSSFTSAPHPSSSSRTTVIPGLAERKPVSAMAGSYASNGNGKATPAPSSAPIAGRWTGTVASSSVAKRWPHQDSASASTKPSLVSPRDETKPAPILPIRKPYLHDWLPEHGQQKENSQSKSSSVISPSSVSTSATKVQEDSDSSDDEIEKPEDVNEHVAPDSIRHSAMGEELLERQTEANTAETSKYALSVKKDKSPHWLQHHNGEDSITADTETKAISPLQKEENASHSTTAQTTVEATSPDHKVSASAPAWDEDDEEMHFLPEPDLNDNRRYEQARTQQTTTATQTKRYADASTSPGRNTPVQMSPVGDRHSLRSNHQQEITHSNVAIASERKPPSVLSPKPIRSLSTKELGVLKSRSQDYQQGSISPEMKATSSSLVQQRKDSLVNGSASNISSSNMGPPPVTAPKPSSSISNASRSHGVSSVHRSNTIAKTSMKPWEKEAYEKEQVHKYGSLRSSSPAKSGSLGEEYNERPEDQDRFSGVSSLIIQWQTNSTKRAPGWGHLGGASHDGQLQDDVSYYKQDENIIKGSSTINSATGSSSRPFQVRLPSREV